MIFGKRLDSRLRFAVAGLALAAGLCAVSYAYASEAAHHSHWAYEGEAGPENWGKVSPEYGTCSAGQHQSPIDISGAVDEKLADIAFSYKPTKLNIVNNGHTIQVNYDKGSSIKVNGEDYELVQFHFHDPSEHTVAGKSFGMELHLVHKNAKGELAVVGVLIENGKENAAYKKIWANLPKKAEEKKAVNADIDANGLLPKDRAYYTYTGSLTTPPCTENVTWLVLKTPVQMSQAQIKKFKAIFAYNNRPVQPVNGRKISAEAKN